MAVIPFAVYGTLREGCSNGWRLQGRAESSAMGVVGGYGLFIHRNLPWAVPMPGAELVVEVVWPRPELYGQVLADVDMLEGYRPGGPLSQNLYVRQLVAVSVPSGGCEAWLYEAAPGWAEKAASGYRVRSGDYLS